MDPGNIFSSLEDERNIILKIYWVGNYVIADFF